MNESRDVVERAFELLRLEHAPELADPVLEGKLRARFARRRRRARRFLIPVVAVGALAGAGFAASGGISWLRSWWYSVEVDGVREDGVVEGEGARTFEVETDDGGRAFVSIQRELLDDDTTRTRIAIDHETDGGIDVERAEDVFGRRQRVFLPATALGDSSPFYVGADSTGARFELHALEDEAGGSHLLVHRPEEDPARVVESLARVPFALLGDGSRAEITELRGGGLSLSFDDGRGGVFQFVWTDDASRAPASELQTPDGGVRVRVENTPLHDTDPSRSD